MNQFTGTNNDRHRHGTNRFVTTSDVPFFCVEIEYTAVCT